jgi:hypothetical protein
MGDNASNPLSCQTEVLSDESQIETLAFEVLTYELLPAWVVLYLVRGEEVLIIPAEKVSCIYIRNGGEDKRRFEGFNTLKEKNGGEER